MPVERTQRFTLINLIQRSQDNRTLRGENGKVVDLAQQRRIKELLNASPIEPNGGVYLKKYEHKDKVFIVVALKAHYSQKAIRMLQELLAAERPGQLLVEGLGNQVPEVKFLESEAKRLNIPAKDVILTPYNKVVSDLAGVEEREALGAIIMSELSRYAQDPEIVVDYLSNTFNLHSKAIDLLFTQIWPQAETDAAFRAKSLRVLQILLEVSNDLSWHKLRGLNLSAKKILVLVGDGHSEIFDPGYRPKRIPEIAAEELQKIQDEIQRYECGLQRSRSPREPAESILDLLQPKGIVQARELVGHLQENPNDEIARQRLKKLMFPKIAQWMAKGDYPIACRWAEEMLKAGIEEARELFYRAFRALYGKLMKGEDFLHACEWAQVLEKWGLEDAPALIEAARLKMEESGR